MLFLTVMVSCRLCRLARWPNASGHEGFGSARFWLSEGFCGYMRTYEEKREAVAEKEAAVAETKPLVRVWNDQRLRAGDRIGGHICVPESEDSQRRNQF